MLPLPNRGMATRCSHDKPVLQRNQMRKRGVNRTAAIVNFFTKFAGWNPNAGTDVARPTCDVSATSPPRREEAGAGQGSGAKVGRQISPQPAHAARGSEFKSVRACARKPRLARTAFEDRELGPYRQERREPLGLVRGQIQVANQVLYIRVL